MAQYRAQRERAGAQRDREHAVLRLRRRRRWSPTAIAALSPSTSDHLFKHHAGRRHRPASGCCSSSASTSRSNFPFSVFGGVISGFQRYDANNMVAIGEQHRGGAGERRGPAAPATGWSRSWRRRPAVRIVALLRLPAERVPRLSRSCGSRPSLFRRGRLREVTGFSVYSSIIDWANKLNYQLDELVIGVFLGSAAVAVWAVGRADHLRHAAAHEPVERRAVPRRRRQRRHAAAASGCSRSSCRARGCRSRWCVPIAAALILLADPLVHAWLGRRRCRRGPGHPDSRDRRRDPRRQRDRHHAAQGRRRAPACSRS